MSKSTIPIVPTPAAAKYIPIGLPSPGEVNQQQDCIYPDFSTTSTLYRFSQRKGSFISRWTEIDLANEALGAFFTIQIVCGPYPDEEAFDPGWANEGGMPYEGHAYTQLNPEYFDYVFVR